MNRRALVLTLLALLAVWGWALLRSAAALEWAEQARTAAAEARGEDRWFALEIDRAEPLTDGDGACSLGRRARLRFGHRLLAGGSGPPRRATCLYDAVLPGHGAECLIEYRGSPPTGYTPTNPGARLADRYYRRNQGGIGYLHGNTDNAEPRIFLVLDDRWCRWFRSGQGFLLH